MDDVKTRILEPHEAKSIIDGMNELIDSIPPNQRIGLYCLDELAEGYRKVIEKDAEKNESKHS